MMKITLKMLYEKRVCSRYQIIFKQTFGLAAEVTLENCILAQKKGLILDRAAEKFLSRDAQTFYKKTWNEAMEIYGRKINAIKQQLNIKTHESPIMNKAYHEALGAHLEILHQVKPRAFYEAFREDHEKESPNLRGQE